MKSAVTRGRYTKLNDGTWGIRVKGECPKVGETIQCAKRDGMLKIETVQAVLQSQTDAHVCRIVDVPRKTRTGGPMPRNAIGRSGARCADCGGPLETWMDGFSAGICSGCA